MQGEPRVEIDKRIRKGAEEYWSKILSAQYQLKRKEIKRRLKQNKETIQKRCNKNKFKV